MTRMCAFYIFWTISNYSEQIRVGKDLLISEGYAVEPELVDFGESTKKGTKFLEGLEGRVGKMDGAERRELAIE